MLPAALRMGAPCSPCPPTHCDAPTGWPSSTPGSDPLGVTKAVFLLHAGHGPGSWSPHSHQNQMPSQPSSLFPVPQLLAPPTLNTRQRGAPQPPLVQWPGSVRAQPGSVQVHSGLPPKCPDHRLSPYTCFCLIGECVWFCGSTTNAGV